MSWTVVVDQAPRLEPSGWRHATVAVAAVTATAQSGVCHIWPYTGIRPHPPLVYHEDCYRHSYGVVAYGILVFLHNLQEQPIARLQPTMLFSAFVISTGPVRQNEQRLSH